MGPAEALMEEPPPAAGVRWSPAQAFPAMVGAGVHIQDPELKELECFVPNTQK